MYSDYYGWIDGSWSEAGSWLEAGDVTSPKTAVVVPNDLGRVLELGRAT